MGVEKKKKKKMPKKIIIMFEGALFNTITKKQFKI